MPDRILSMLATVAVLSLAACAPSIAPVVPGDPGVDAPAGFQDCEPPYAFDGESSFVELGIGDP